ncbi:MAG: signal peptidase I [Chloroflexota bacterium]
MTIQNNPVGDHPPLTDSIEPTPIVEKPQWRYWLIEIFETLVLSLLLFLVINLLTARIEVESVSMEDTLVPGTRVLVSKFSYWGDFPERGDIIVFEPPFESEAPYIKRVIGLPGEKVTINEDGVYVNGGKIPEHYLSLDMYAHGQRSWIVDSDALFVMGDNRDNSSDSRTWGLMPADNIIGKAVFVYWPPSQWGALSATVMAAESP